MNRCAGSWAAAAALGLVALLLARRKRQQGKSDAAVPAAGAAVGGASMLGPLTTLMSSLKKGDGIDLSSVDRVAEADVYLAYGRDDQALEILREGLANEPMRQDLRYKLLEVLSTQQDKQLFIAEATTAKGVFGKDSTLWMRVCEIGQTVAPGHPLFAMAAPVVAEVTPAAPTAPAAPMPAMDEPVAERASEPAAPPRPSAPRRLLLRPQRPARPRKNGAGQAVPGNGRQGNRGCADEGSKRRLIAGFRAGWSQGADAFKMRRRCFCESSRVGRSCWQGLAVFLENSQQKP